MQVPLKGHNLYELHKAIQAPVKGYAHIEIVEALVIVNMLTCLIIASHDVRVMTWEFGDMFSYFSSTFLYPFEATNQAIDPSFERNKKLAMST